MDDLMLLCLRIHNCSRLFTVSTVTATLAFFNYLDRKRKTLEEYSPMKISIVGHFEVSSILYRVKARK